MADRKPVSRREAAVELLRAENLVKDYPGIRAVDGVEFAVQGGEIFGFLGPNGAGKTTTINMLTGLARITSGSVFLAGEEYTRRMKPAQAAMGVVPDESNLYNELSGFDNLCFCAALYGMEKPERERRARALLDQFDLGGAGRRPFRAYSKGMKRKLTIAAGIIHDPTVLFLDEPTTGIDVVAAQQIRRLIHDLNARGTTVFLTTHYIEEAERLCHRIAFIVKGRIVRMGGKDELMREVQAEEVVQLAVESNAGELASRLQERFPGCTVEAVSASELRIVSEESVDLVPFMEFLGRSGTTVFEARLVRPSLEDVFVKVTGIEPEIMRVEREGGKAKG